MESPHTPRSSMPQPPPNWPMTPPGPSVFAPLGPAIQPPDTGVSASRVAFIQAVIFGLIVAAGFFTISGIFLHVGIISRLLVALVAGAALGALGGLLSAALKQQRGGMSKKTIGTLYLISLVLEVFPAIPLVAALTQGYIDTPTIQAIIVLSIIMALCGIPGIIAWIGTLVNLAKAQAWVWFILAFLFGGIAVLIYVFAGPQPQGAGQASLAQQWAPAPPLNAPPGGPAYPPAQPISALDILQQRYARGEIDTATFDQKRARLEARQEQ